MEENYFDSNWIGLFLPKPMGVEKPGSAENRHPTFRGASGISV